MRNENSLLKRAAAILMMSAMMVTYMPLIAADPAFATNKKDETASEEVATRIEKLPEEEVKAQEDDFDAKTEELTRKENAAEGITAPDEETGEDELVPYGEKLVDPEDVKSGVRCDRKKMSLKDSPAPTMFLFTVSEPDSNGIVTVGGYIEDTGYSFDSIYVDDKEVISSGDSVYGKTGFSATINMKNYDVGYHMIVAYLNYNGSYSGYYLYQDYVPTYIYGKPSNKLSTYYTYINKFTTWYNGSSYSYDPSCDVYLMYKNGKKSWTKKNYGPVSTSSYTVSKCSGFKPNSTIKVRYLYAKRFEYNGVQYAFTGRTTKKYSKTVTIKTAYKKPKVKSIKISKVKVKVHKWKVHYANRIRYVKSTGRIISVTPLYHTYRSYQTRFKVTARFKKKQGVAGVCIRTKNLYAWKKGNKKKYSVTFTLSGKKKGKKTTVSVESYRSKTYGGYSKKYKKKLKIR